jgi:hypothetical protein
MAQIIFPQRLPHYQHSSFNFACKDWYRLRKTLKRRRSSRTLCFSSSSPAKMLPGSAFFRKSKWWKKAVTRSGLKGGWGLDSAYPLVENLEFVVLVYLVSKHIALNWLWHLSWIIWQTSFLHCLRRRSLWLSLQKSAPWIFFLSYLPLQSRFSTFRLPYFFSSLKDDLRGRSFSDNDELQHSVRAWRAPAFCDRYTCTASRAKLGNVCW